MAAEDFTLRQALELAVTTEQLAAEYYDKMAGQFAENREVAEVFTRLAKDERGHEVAFRKLAESVPEDQGPSAGDVNYEFLKATSRSQFFTRDTVKKTDDIKTANDALGKALAFEKATMLYYQGIKGVLGDNPQLNELIEAERSHVVSIARILPTDTKFRGMGDIF